MAAATPKTPSDAQPTSENITYEATLNAAASASRFPAGAFLDYAGLKKILEALAEMYAMGDRAAEGLAYASLATTGRDAAAAAIRHRRHERLHARPCLVAHCRRQRARRVAFRRRDTRAYGRDDGHAWGARRLPLLLRPDELQAHGHQALVNGDAGRTSTSRPTQRDTRNTDL